MTLLVRASWIAVLMVASMLAAASMATAAETPLRSVSVTGSGEVKAQPDMAYVTLGVEARRPTLAEARAEVNATVERLLALTRELRIEPKFVDSTRLQVQPDYRWDEKSSSQVLLGYVVSRQVDVELHDAAGAKLGPVQSLSTTGAMPVPMYAERAMSVAAAPMTDTAEKSYQSSEMKFTASVSAQFELLVP